MNVKCSLMTLAGFGAFVLAFATNTQMASAEDRIPGFQYVEEKGETIFEQKRVISYDPSGTLVSKAIHFKNGAVKREVFRKDGTLEFSHEVYKNGQEKEHIEYDTTGKTVTNRKTYLPDGSLWWEATRKADGHTLRKDYNRDGTLRSQRELLDDNGFTETWFRKDGSKWHGSERKPGETGRGTRLYYSADGKTLRRTSDGSIMNVSVVDDKGVELYSQVWICGIAKFQLMSVKEPVTGGGWRVIHLLSGKVKSVEYYKADGTLDRTEALGSVTDPVDATRLQEFNDKDDPTIPRIAILR